MLTFLETLVPGVSDTWPGREHLSQDRYQQRFHRTVPALADIESGRENPAREDLWCLQPLCNTVWKQRHGLIFILLPGTLFAAAVLYVHQPLLSGALPESHRILLNSDL